MDISKPKYKTGDRLVLVDEDPSFNIPHDDNMVVTSPPAWESNMFHPKGGYWAYPISGKSNFCPEDFLTPYVEGQKHYNTDLPCHIYFKQRKRK